MGRSTKALANQQLSFEAIMPGVSQKVAVGAGSVQSAALAATTTVARVVADVDCFLAFAANPTAVADGTSMFLPAGAVEYVGVAQSSKIAVIRSVASGNLYITEGAF